jgi:DNA repair protein RadA/Sms
MLTGDPGIGKSTLLLQIAHKLAATHKVFYFSSEESLEQVKMRAERLRCVDETILFSDQANLDEIIATAQQHQPALIIVDSIQNCYTNQTQALPGSIGQLKESTFRLMRLAKENTIAVLLSGHITKDGAMAGPKTLEHMVDAVFYLQGEDRWQTRVLRSVKNRFGTVNELGFFDMDEHGLREVPNINQHLLEEITQNPGSALISHIEGSRPLLLELQALTIATKFGIPQRVVTGLDQKQVVLIAAILEKYLQIKLSSQDIFFKISGSLKIKGSTSDLGIALALLSSYFQQPLPQKSVALGEISLTGQIKPINHINLHMSEIEKFGVKQLFIAHNQKLNKTICTTKKFSHVYELLKLFE